MENETLNKKDIRFCHQILTQTETNPKWHNLILGNIGALKPQIAKIFQTQAVVTVMDQYMYKKYDVPAKIQTLGIKKQNHLWINLQDDQQSDILPYFNEAHQFIDQNLPNRNVLVHCQAGISRSATIVISYVMKTQKMNLQQANKFVVQRRYVVAPNIGFLQALQKYEKQLEMQELKGKKYQGVPDPQSDYTKENYSTKFCNHIISFKDPSILQSNNLFLGQATFVASNYLQKYKITSVLTILTEGEYRPLKIMPLCEHLGIAHKHIKLDDAPQENISQHFEQCHNFIDKGLKEGNVFVHCKVGKSRSATIIISYLMKKFSVSADTALEFVSSKRSVVGPNKGFIEQLKIFEKDCKKH